MSSAASTPKADAKPEPAVAAALSPRTRWVEKALHENEIEPATELVAYLPEVGDTLEPYALVKADRSIVRCVNSADHDVFSQAQSKGK